MTPVDTVGAGDAITAGLLHRLHQGGARGAKLDALDPDLLGRALTFASDVALRVGRRGVAGRLSGWTSRCRFRRRRRGRLR
uniref:hypothetical protein n=1 Tax=Actinomadura sp. OS1-43 TaxID=604315 RepID=UPI003341DC8A